MKKIFSLLFVFLILSSIVLANELNIPPYWLRTQTGIRLDANNDGIIDNCTTTSNLNGFTGTEWVLKTLYNSENTSQWTAINAAQTSANLANTNATTANTNAIQANTTANTANTNAIQANTTATKANTNATLMMSYNSTIARTGTCNGLEVIQNTTISGVKCINFTYGYSNVNITGNTGYIALIKNNTVLNNSVLFQNGSNLGIGTNSPGNNLQVVGSPGVIVVDTLLPTSSPAFYYKQNDTRMSFIQHVDANDTLTFASEYGDMAFKTASTQDTDSDTEYMRIKSGGNIGIGTNAPVASLQIARATGSATIGSQSFSYVALMGANTGGLFIGHNATTADVAITSSTNGADLILGTRTGGANYERIRILDTGQIGIGTTTPSAKLDVGGDVFVNQTLAQRGYSDEYGLDLYLTFDESNGTVYDRSPYGNDGLMNCTNNCLWPPTRVKGLSGFALNFTGEGTGATAANSSVVNIPSYTIGSNGYTLEAWVNSYNITQDQIYLARGNIYMRIASSKASFSISNGTQQILTGTTILKQDEWYHIAAVCDNSSGTIEARIYVNGQLDNNMTRTGPCVVTSVATTLGTFAFTGTYRLFGMLDEIRVYNHPLTQDQIKLQYLRSDRKGVVDTNVFRIINLTGNVNFQVNANGNTGIKTNNPQYPLDVEANVSGISIYSQANISAAGYITRTNVFTGVNAVNQIKNSSEYYKNGKINHETFGYSYVNYTIPVKVQNCTTSLVDVRYDNCTISEITEEKVCNPYDTKEPKEECNPYTEYKNEEGVDLEKEIALIKQALYETIQKNKELETRIQKLETTPK